MADENYSYAPKYVQIQNYILQKIESGEYAAGVAISWIVGIVVTMFGWLFGLGSLLLGLLDGLLRLLPLRGLLGLLLFCSAIGAEFHGFRDFFAAVVTIHVPLSFIF